jgi:hypothetical protein
VVYVLGQINLQTYKPTNLQTYKPTNLQTYKPTNLKKTYKPLKKLPTNHLHPLGRSLFFAFLQVRISAKSLTGCEAPLTSYAADLSWTLHCLPLTFFEASEAPQTLHCSPQDPVYLCFIY